MNNPVVFVSILLSAIMFSSSLADETESPALEKWRTEVRTSAREEILSLWNKPHTIRFGPGIYDAIFKHATRITQDDSTVSFMWQGKRVIVSAPFMIVEE